MMSRTRLRSIWENPVHAVWIILAMLEIAAFFAGFDRFIFHGDLFQELLRKAIPRLPEFLMRDILRMLWAPYIVAGGIRVGEGISAFSGNLIRGIWTPEHALVIISMVLSYILGPSLLVWGLNARKKWLIERPAGLSSVRILIATAAGGYIVFFALLVPIEASIASWNALQRMKSDSHINAMRDGAISSVSALGFQAQQLRWLPETTGGGPWRDGPGGITIGDLEKVLPGLERGVWPQGVGGSMKYFLEVASPDSLTIWGVADVRGTFSGATFRNKDGTTGNVQVRAGVTLERVKLAVEN